MTLHRNGFIKTIIVTILERFAGMLTVQLKCNIDDVSIKHSETYKGTLHWYVNNGT